VRSLLDRNQHWLNEAVPKAEGGFFRAFGRMVRCAADIASVHIAEA